MPPSGTGTEASVRSLTSADLSAFCGDFIRPDNATIFVTGDTTLDAMLPLLDATFGDWIAPSSPRPTKNLAYVAARERPRLFLIHREGAQQSQIIAGSLVSPTPSPWYMPTQMANAIIGGTFTSRLNMNLREEKRWSYGARSAITDAIGQRPLVISTAVQADKTAESIREAFNELKAFSSHRPPTADEIEKIKLQTIRMLPGSYETAVSVLATLSTNQLYGRPDDYVPTLKQNLESQTEVQVAAAAKEFFSPNAFTWFVIGDLTKVEQAVRSLDMGEVVVLDAADIDGNQGV
jgi:zinc protease